MKVIVAETKGGEGFWRILCPKDGERVPIYQCAGSFVKGKWMCDYLGLASIGIKEAKVECLYPEKREET